MAEKGSNAGGQISRSKMDLQRMQKAEGGEAFTRNHEEKIEVDRRREDLRNRQLGIFRTTKNEKRSP